MADSTIPRPTDGPPAPGPVITGSAHVFEPRAPEPLPDDWDPPPPQTPISHAPLRHPRKRRVMPFLVGLTIVGAAGGVGHHWYLRQHLPQREPAHESERHAVDAPYSLRAAWREVSRGVAAMRNPPPEAATPVVSVLDDPGVAARPEPPSRVVDVPRSSPPSAAELLAERMAAAAASEAAASKARSATSESEPPPASAIEHAPSEAPAASFEKPTPATTPSAPPPAAVTTHVPAAAPDAVAAHRSPPAQPSSQSQRAPGMVGLGGPPAMEAPAREKRGAHEPPKAAKPRAPQRRNTRETAAPTASGRRVTHAASAGAASPSRSRPRRPYRRPASASSEQPQLPSAELPALFKRIERRMP